MIAWDSVNLDVVASYLFLLPRRLTALFLITGIKTPASYIGIHTAIAILHGRKIIANY